MASVSVCSSAGMTVIISESFNPSQKSSVRAALRKPSSVGCVGTQLTVASTRSAVSIRLTDIMYIRGYMNTNPSPVSRK